AASHAAYEERDMTEEKLAEIGRELAAIKERNARVEADKAWEVSYFRIAAICVITYLVALALLYTIGAERCFLAALMPTLGFFISTQSLPALKKWWIKSRGL